MKIFYIDVSPHTQRIDSGYLEVFIMMKLHNSEIESAHAELIFFFCGNSRKAAISKLVYSQKCLAVPGVRNVIPRTETRALIIIIDRIRYKLLTLVNSSVAAPTVTVMTIPFGTTTYEVGGGTTITLTCMTSSPGVTYSWKQDGTIM